MTNSHASTVDHVATKPIRLMGAHEIRLRLGGVSRQRAYQITVEARRRWEYGRPPEQPDPLAEDAPPPDGPRPAEPSTPEGTPPPEPREPVP